MNQLRGLSYTLRHESEIGAGLPTGPRRMAWVGETLLAATRGRMLFVSGGVEKIFDTGDYALFDANATIVVKPAEKTFSVPTLGPRTTAAASRIPVTISNLQWSLDMLGDQESIDGVATTHHRVDATYDNRIQPPLIDDPEAFEMPPVVTTYTCDYWCARIEGLPQNASNPFQPWPLFSASAAGMALSPMWASIGAQLAPSGTPLESRVILQTQCAGAVTVTTTETIISNIRRSSVDADALVLPIGFTQSHRGASDGDLAIDIVDKWRTLPNA